MSKLFEKYSIRNLELKNRIMMAPMCMYSSDQTGQAKRWHKVHYETRAIGGVGLIMIEATGVEPRGRISENDLGIWDDAHIQGLKEIVDACHDHGAKVGIQLAHAGRKSDTHGDPILAPSAIPYSDAFREPKAMTKEDIIAVVKSFGKAAARANLAGFDLIEIHGAHGYLINEFLSPLTNFRTDEYGGRIENRVRFLCEILDEVHLNWPAEKPINLRISAEDYVAEGNHPEDLGAMLNLVKLHGIDHVNVSSGGVVEVVPKVYPGYQIKMAEIVSQISACKTIAGGLITTPEMAEEIVSNNRAEMVFLGRELLRNPYWPLNTAKKVRAEGDWPRQYLRGKL